jgi:hypothetical protein
VLDATDATDAGGSAVADGFARSSFPFPFGFPLDDPLPERFTFAIAFHLTPIRCLGERVNEAVIGAD